METYDRSNIFQSIKESVGLSIEDVTFDNDLIMYINTTISTLYQMGVGTNITINPNSQWSELKDDDQVEGNKSFEMVKQYVFLSVRLVFDPPPTATYNILKSSLDMLEWRIHFAYNQQLGDKK